VTNAVSGAIADGVVLEVVGTVDNRGTITTPGTVGVLLSVGGTVSNGKNGLISGGTVGIFAPGRDATVINAGRISGSTFAVQFTGSNDRLVVDPGAVFVGKVTGGSSRNILELASAAHRGTITGLGTSFTNFNTIVVDRRAQWEATGTNSLASGTALVVRGKLTDVGALTLAAVGGPGTIQLSPDSVLTADGRFDVGHLRFLAGGHEIAAFGAPATVSSTIARFAESDTVDLLGFVVTKLSFTGHTLTADGAHGAVAHLKFAASFRSNDFAFAPDDHGGTNITLV